MISKANLLSVGNVLFIKSLAIFSNLIISFLFINCFSVEEFGNYSILYLSSVLIAQIICLGLPQIIIKQVNNSKSINETFTYSLVQILISGLVLCIIFYFLFLLGLGLVFLTNLVIALIIAFNTVCSAYLRVRNFISLSQVTESILRQVLVLIVLSGVYLGYFETESQDFAILLLCGALLGAVFQSAIIFINFADGILIAFTNASFNKLFSFVHTHMKTSISIFSASLLNQSVTNIVILLSGYLVGSQFLGELRFASQVAALMFLMLFVVNIVFGPSIAAVSQGMGSRYLLFKIQKLLVGINLILGVTILLIYDHAFVLLFGGELTNDVLTYVWILLAFAMLEVSIGPVGQFLVLQGYEKFYLRTTLAIFLPAFLIITLLFYFDLLILSVVVIGLSRLILKVICYLRVLGQKEAMA